MKTYKFYLMIAVMMMATVAAKAQTSETSFGLKAGLNYASLPSNLSAITDKKGKIGYNLGAFARIGTSLYFQPELNYVTFKSSYNYAAQTYTPKFHQLNLPLMVGYKLINTDALNFRISAGPDLNYTLNKAVGPAGFDYKKLNVGGVINAGVDIGNLTLDARYSRGFTKINKQLQEKTNLFNLSVGLKVF
ncbi:porin family protein [Pedobacter sp. KR3-3]|uniref:Porin family protein n=1 Tax=Pedobacter albus TaxID=3113905 RepID=A0ABU7I2U0_9SPHI|nr:porin family protein [Pedobacter sp. KR3-3]MEE1943775.1 porin family protein [Pedobacter sp. KR3-3]